MNLAARPGTKKRRLPSKIIAALALAAHQAGAQTTVSINAKVAEVACAIYNAFIDIGGALASLVFLFAAVQWITARNDAESRVRHRETMTHAIIGILVLVFIKIMVMAVAGITDADLPANCK